MARLFARRRALAPNVGKHSVKAPILLASRRQVVVSGHCIRCMCVHRAKRVQLVAQHIEDQPRIRLWIVHMPRKKPPIVVVFNKVVIWVAGKGQRVEPERVDRRLSEFGQSGPHRGQMWQIVP